MDLTQFVYNPLVDFQKCYCFDSFLSQEDFTDLVKSFEEKTGMVLMGYTKDIVPDGFLSMTKQTRYCGWGKHKISGEHTSVIVSLYKNGKIDNESLFDKAYDQIK